MIPYSLGGPRQAWRNSLSVHRARFVCPNYQVSRLAELQDIVTFSVRTSPSISFPSRSHCPVPSAGPRPREARSQGRGWRKRGLRRDPLGDAMAPPRPFPPLFVCHYRRVSRNSSAFLPLNL